MFPWCYDNTVPQFGPICKPTRESLSPKDICDEAVRWRRFRPWGSYSSLNSEATRSTSSCKTQHSCSSPIEAGNDDPLTGDNNIPENSSTPSLKNNNNEDNFYCCVDPFCQTCLQTSETSESAESQSPDYSRSPVDSEHPETIYLTTPSPLSFDAIYCDIHQDEQQFYCFPCGIILCTQCDEGPHRNHMTAFLAEAMKLATSQANGVMQHAEFGISSTRGELCAIQMELDTLNFRARTAARDVKNSAKYLINAIEERTRVYLMEIERARAIKQDRLKAREAVLSTNLSKLLSIVNHLTDVMRASVLSGNPLHLINTKDEASADMYRIARNPPPFISPDDSWISYNGHEINLSGMLAEFGTISYVNPGVIGDGRASRGLIDLPAVMQQLGSNITYTPRRLTATKNSHVTVTTGRDSTSITHAVHIFGNESNSSDKLSRPWGIACDKDGFIIVADRSNDRIQIYKEDGTIVRRFGTSGTGPVEFQKPAGVAVDSRRRLIVADKDNHRIQVLTMEGRFIFMFGQLGSQPGEFNYPWDVAVNKDCEIVVSDTRNHRIQLFSPEGVFLRMHCFYTSPNLKSLDLPRGVAFTPEGDVVLTNFNAHTIMLVDAKFTQIKVLAGFYENYNEKFMRPQGLVVDDAGNIIVSDSRNNRIQVLDRNGKLMWTFGNFGNGSHQLDRPAGITLTPKGHIALIDFGNDRVMIF